MRQSRLVTGRVPRDWEWGIVNTPEEWWLDYAVNHPDYDPYTLDSESGARLYGPQFRFLGDVSEEDPDGFYKFLIPHFGDSFKYLLVLNRYKEKTYRPIEKYDLNYPGVGSPFYDPMVETPDAYSHFCRISRLVNIGQSDKRVIKEVLKFVSKYGPPWYTEYAKLHTPPFCDPPNGPLTIDGILWESLNMASALHTYRLLQDLNEDIRAERTLRKHLADVFRRQNQSSGIHYNLTIVESKYTHVDWDYHTLPPLDTRTQLEQAAIAFVIGSVNCGLTTTGVKFGLTNKLGRGL